MRVYLYFDTENVRLEDFTPLMEQYIPNLEITLTVSTNSKPLRLEFLPAFVSAKYKLNVINMDPRAHNSMDFVLTAELTRRAFKAPKSLHILVSNDQGFLAALHYLNKEFGLRTYLRGSPKAIFDLLRKNGFNTESTPATPVGDKS